MADLDNLFLNPALQFGLGILANNQGNYGSFGAAIGKGGMMGLQNIQRAKMQEVLQKQQQMQMDEMQRRIKEQQDAREAQARLLSGRDGYMTEQDQPYTRTENVPMPAQEGAQAPNFGLMSQTTSGVNKVPTFDNKKYMGDLVTAGFGDDLIKNQMASQFRTVEPEYAYSDGILYDKKTGKYQQIGQPTTSSTSLGKMIAEMNALPPDSPLRSIYQNAIRKETTFAPPMTIQNYPAPMAAINPATGQQELVQFGNKGDARPTGFKPVASEKLPTEGQAKAATFYSQMTSASKELENLTQSGGYDPKSLSGQLSASMASGITNPLAGSGAQRARQAQNQWAESFLRIKTGAAATAGEVKQNVETFFPQIGDSPAVIAQKARMRAQAEEDVKAMTANPNNILPRETTQQKPRSKADILKQYGVK